MTAYEVEKRFQEKYAELKKWYSDLVEYHFRKFQRRKDRQAYDCALEEIRQAHVVRWLALEKEYHDGMAECSEAKLQ